MSLGGAESVLWFNVSNTLWQWISGCWSSNCKGSVGEAKACSWDHVVPRTVQRSRYIALSYITKFCNAGWRCTFKVHRRRTSVWRLHWLLCCSAVMRFWRAPVMWLL